jgi:hypothetical protein
MLGQISAVASIPSPASDSLHVGPLEVRAYGLMIGLGVVVPVLLGVRVNLWVSATVFVTAVMVLVIRHRGNRDGSNSRTMARRWSDDRRVQPTPSRLSG